MKIIFLNSHPISYFSDMYRYLRSNGLNFEVWYCSKYGLNNHFDIQFNSFRKTEGLLEGFKSKFLLNFLKAKNAKETIFNTLNPSILKEISNLDRNTIVISHGWSRLTMVLTLIFGGMFGVKVGLRTETPLTHEYNYKGVKKSLRTFILKNSIWATPLFRLSSLATKRKGKEGFCSSDPNKDQSIFVLT